MAAVPFIGCLFLCFVYWFSFFLWTSFCLFYLFPFVLCLPSFPCLFFFCSFLVFPFPSLSPSLYLLLPVSFLWPVLDFFDLVLLFSPSFLFFLLFFFLFCRISFSILFPFLLFVFVFLSCFRVVFLDLCQFDIKLSLFFEFFLKIIWFVSVKFLPLHPLSGLKPCRALRESSLTD